LLPTNVRNENNFTHLTFRTSGIGANWLETTVPLYMNFDQNVSSTTTYDYSNFSNDGSLSGVLWNQSGWTGGAYQFDGTDDLITVPTSGSIDVFLSTKMVSVAAWVKPYSHGAGIGGIFNKGCDVVKLRPVPEPRVNIIDRSYGLIVSKCCIG